MEYFRNVHERKMIVRAHPRREPETDLCGGNTNVIGNHSGREDEPRNAEVK